MDFIYEQKTDKTFEQAVKDLTANLAAHSFGVLWQLNFKDKLQEKGLEFDYNFMVLEVCNPAQAKKVLDQKLEMGYMLPCKMAIYEKDGVVRLGMMKPQALVQLMGETDLGETALEVEMTLRKAIDDSIH